MPELSDRIRALPTDTLTALSFFSRLPIRPRPGTFDLGRSAGAWPLAGLLIAILPALVFAIACALWMPPGLGALFVVATSALITGAMHEDGLADTADGFGGGETLAEKLAIMRDSRLGTYGALALIVSVLIRAGAIGAIGFSPVRGALAIVAAAMLSRAFALWHWYATTPARSDGMAASAGFPDRPAFILGAMIAAIPALLLIAVSAYAAILGLLMAATGVWLFSRLANRQIGGHTGDTIGAAQQIAETLLLAGFAAGWFVPGLGYA